MHFFGHGATSWFWWSGLGLGFAVLESGFEDLGTGFGYLVPMCEEYFPRCEP